MPYRARVFGLKILLYKPLFFPQSKLVLASNNALVLKIPLSQLKAILILSLIINFRQQKAKQSRNTIKQPKRELATFTDPKIGNITIFNHIVINTSQNFASTRA